MESIQILLFTTFELTLASSSVQFRSHIRVLCGPELQTCVQVQCLLLVGSSVQRLFIYSTGTPSSRCLRFNVLRSTYFIVSIFRISSFSSSTGPIVPLSFVLLEQSIILGRPMLYHTKYSLHTHIFFNTHTVGLLYILTSSICHWKKPITCNFLNVNEKQNDSDSTQLNITFIFILTLTTNL